MIFHYDNLIDPDEEYRGSIDFEVDEDSFEDRFFPKYLLKTGKAKTLLKAHYKDIDDETKQVIKDFYELDESDIEKLVDDDEIFAGEVLFKLIDTGKVPEIMKELKDYYYDYAYDKFAEEPWNYSPDYEGEAADMAYEQSRDARYFGL